MNAAVSSRGSKPATYAYSGIESFYFCTYDDQGNLFVDGQAFSGPTYLFELRKGQSSLDIVKAPTLSDIAPIQWDGADLAIYVGGGNDDARVLRVAVRKYRAKVEGKVNLKGPQGYSGQFWIQGSTIIGPEDRSANLALWNYPEGGKPAQIVQDAGYPFGVTVSAGSSR